MTKRILFVTGTRADFGKLKPLISAVQQADGFDYQIFGTGMHTMAQYGNTILEITRSGFSNLFTYMNQVAGEDMEVILANTIIGLSRYLHENRFDLIVVHGDRVEALAGATVGALRNIRVAHIVVSSTHSSVIVSNPLFSSSCSFSPLKSFTSSVYC